MKDLETLCKSAVEIIKEAGNYIRNERLNFDQKNIEFKSSRDMVSYVDKNAEKMLVAELGKLLPEAGFITEEKTTDKTGAINWIIDPLDGTTNFISGFPLYSSTLALERNNEILVGVTYDICADKCYYAWKGGGSYCDDKKITVKSNNKLEKALVIIGTPYSMGEIGTEYFSFIRHIYENSLGVRITGSAAIDMAYVAAGYNDAFILFNQKPWDIAAGYILMKEAGGYATTFSGKEDIHCPEILTSGNLQDELLTLLKQFGVRNS